MASSLSTALYPLPARDALAALYVGSSIRDLPTPAAVINVAAARRNCQRMLQACDGLGLGWRAHVKTHKTAELTRLQVGDDAARPVNIVVSTLAEAEFLVPTLADYQRRGRRVNVLYGLPLAPGAVPRLSAVARALGEAGVSVLLDDPAQLPAAAALATTASGVVPHVYVKIDMGGRRAGVVASSPRFVELVDAALDAHARGTVRVAGLYSHAGHSYNGGSRAAAVRMLMEELAAVLDGADRLRAAATARAMADGLPQLVVSVGASPTALSVQNMIASTTDGDVDDAELQAETASLAALLRSVRDRGHAVEIHAGVYPLLDLQQLAAHSMASSRLSWADVALTVLAEVHSIYPGRGAGGTTEALISAGTLALGREPCKAYEGMAMLTPWGQAGVAVPAGDVEHCAGWIVGRSSQEHGILTWRPGRARDEEQPAGVAVGQKVRLWPNHACITSSQYGWYFVVDEDRAGKEDEVVDIWIRAKGW